MVKYSYYCAICFFRLIFAWLIHWFSVIELVFVRCSDVVYFCDLFLVHFYRVHKSFWPGRDSWPNTTIPIYVGLISIIFYTFL